MHGAAPEPASDVDREEEDDPVVAALRAGDARVALPLLMDRYGLRVYRYCRRMLGSDADGDDASQIVFLQAFEAIQRRAEVHDVRAWLLGIARNRCLDRLARRGRGPLLVEEEHFERAVDAVHHCQPTVGDPRARQALDRCLDALDARSRAVVLRRFEDDLSYDEISKLTGDKPGALRVRVARALTALRRCMDRGGEAP